ncbi:MAG: hypothetical protein EP319_05605 [Deltaproteobacteria bacterium]|nr:MAG: hypothetical protein EP319_05605 [Deltaproteobacteria bacterium]
MIKMIFILSIQAFILMSPEAFGIDVSAITKKSKNITAKVLMAIGQETRPSEKMFKEVDSEEIKYNYTNDFIWLKLKLDNTSSTPVKKILKLQHTMAGEVLFYDQDGNELARTGSAINWEERAIQSHYPAMEVEIPPNSSQHFYIRRHSHHRFDTRVLLTSKDELEKRDLIVEKIVHIYSGALLALLIYNLFLGLYTRKKVYLYYSAFIGSMGLLALNMQGALDHIFSFLPFNPSDYLLMTSSGAGFLALVFTNRFLKWNIRYPKFKKFYYFVCTGMLLHFVLFPFLKPIVGAGMGNTVDLFIGLTLLSMLSMGIKSSLDKEPLAYFYMASWTGIFIGAGVWFGMYYKVFPHNMITQTSLLWGNMIEMLVISLGLAYQITILDKEKERAQLDAVGKEKYQTLARVLLHDIVNPLSLILNYSKRLKKNGMTAEQIEITSEKINRAVDMILNIIETVKDQESISIEDISGRIETVYLKEVIDDSLFIYQKRLDEKNIAVECPDKLPKIKAEKNLLTNQVISNILSNAVKFSDPNSKITISFEIEGANTVLTIQDYGQGMNESDLEMLENRGAIKSRLGTLGEKGTGYGILIMKTFVKAMNGNIRIESKSKDKYEDSGTKISLSFPSA